MQLSAKALLKPFSSSSKDTDDSSNDEDTEGGLITPFEEYDGDVESDEDGVDLEVEDKEDDEEEDSLDELNEEDRKKLSEDTLAVRSTLNKVCTNISNLLCFTHIYLL